MSAASFLSKEEQQQIVNAIEAAELLTSGEIRVHLESRCTGDVLHRSAEIFHRLKMDNTEERNGVLIYVAYLSHHFAIIGDQGINEKVPADFWDQIKERMREDFSKENFCEGVCRAIRAAGEQLRTWFPYQKNDINEQPNDISFGQ